MTSRISRSTRSSTVAGSGISCPPGVCDDRSRVDVDRGVVVDSQPDLRDPAITRTVLRLDHHDAVGGDRRRDLEGDVLAGGVGSADPPRGPHVVVEGHGGPILRPSGAAAERGRGGPSRVLGEGSLVIRRSGVGSRRWS